MANEIFRGPLVAPPIRARRLADYTWTQSPFTITPSAPAPPVVQAPFVQKEWPNPEKFNIRRILAWRDYTWVDKNEFLTTLKKGPPQPIALPKPFVRTEFPDPQHLHFKDLTWTQSPFTITPSAPAVTPEAPFYETKHPNPPDLRPIWRDQTFVMTPYIENIVPSGPFVPPVVVEEVRKVKPSGGIPAREFRDVVDRRRIQPKVVRIIEQVAESQVARLEIDKQKQFEELARELELEKVGFETQYLEALALKREMLIDAEIERLIKRKFEDEAMLLILLAATL